MLSECFPVVVLTRLTLTRKSPSSMTKLLRVRERLLGRSCLGDGYKAD